MPPSKSTSRRSSRDLACLCNTLHPRSNGGERVISEGSHHRAKCIMASTCYAEVKRSRQVITVSKYLLDRMKYNNGNTMRPVLSFTRQLQQA